MRLELTTYSMAMSPNHFPYVLIEVTFTPQAARRSVLAKTDLGGQKRTHRDATAASAARASRDTPPVPVQDHRLGLEDRRATSLLPLLLVAAAVLARMIRSRRLRRGRLFSGEDRNPR